MAGHVKYCQEIFASWKRMDQFRSSDKKFMVTSSRPIFLVSGLRYRTNLESLWHLFIIFTQLFQMQPLLFWSSVDISSSVSFRVPLWTNILLFEEETQKSSQCRLKVENIESDVKGNCPKQ